MLFLGQKLKKYERNLWHAISLDQQPYLKITNELFLIFEEVVAAEKG